MDLLTIDSLPESLRGAIAFTDLSPGETLFTQGDDATAVFAVETGRVKLVRYTSEGKMVTFEVVKGGEIFSRKRSFFRNLPLHSHSRRGFAGRDLSSRSPTICPPKPSRTSRRVDDAPD